MKRSGKSRLWLGALGGCALAGATLAVYAYGGPLTLRQARVPKASSPGASQSPPPSPLWCPPDAVRVGPSCVDRYEASVWLTTDATLIQKIQDGSVTEAELSAGAIRKGATMDDYDPECPDTGNHCQLEFAVSIAGVLPSARITWFQAAAACRNAGKRLLTNAEWQVAALGTPDGGPCIVSGSGPGPTGRRGGGILLPVCVSDVGAFDMVGNVWEWVADWVPPATSCSSALFGTGDFNCMTISPTDSSTPNGPTALIRGGSFADDSGAGVFAVLVDFRPSVADGVIGFRCAR